MIDGNSDTVKKTISVGIYPSSILVTKSGLPHMSLEPPPCCKIYVVNSFSGTVSVIDGNSDTVKKDIPVDSFPGIIVDNPGIIVDNPEIYVGANHNVSVIDVLSDTVTAKIISPVSSTMYIANDHTVYVLFSNHKNAYRISGNYTSSIKDHQPQLKYSLLHPSVSAFRLANQIVPLFVGLYEKTAVHDFVPSYEKIYERNDNEKTAVHDFVPSYEKIYERNDNGTVSVVVLVPSDISVGYRYCSELTNDQTNELPCITTPWKHIVIGQHPGPIAINDKTHIIYIGYPGSGTVSVIKSVTDEVAAGVVFNVNPPESGIIQCNGTTYPTNTYIYVDSGTNCTAENIKGFEFNTWTESPLTNRNSSTPLEQSSQHPESITVDRYGIFTANFRLPHQLSSQELFNYLTGAISAAVAVIGALLVVPGWRRTRNQRTHLIECMKMIDDDIGKSHKDAIEEKIVGYCVEGKLSEDHRQLLKDKISEYYGSVKGSESGV